MVRPVSQRAQARRAQQTPWRVRLANIAVPSVVLGLATTGVVAAASGSTTAVPQSGPAPAVTVGATGASSVTLRADPRQQSTSRSQTGSRPALDADQAAVARRKAAAKQAALKKAAAEKAAAKKAAASRRAKAEKPPLTVVDTEYTRVDLNVRSGADVDASLVTVLTAGSKVRVTTSERHGWRWIAYDGRGAWVKDSFLVETKPKVATSATSGALSAGSCPGGSAVESGLTPDAVRVHRAVCARFPSITAYGGVRADSLPEHPSGRALDAMVSDNDLGWQLARWVRANAQRLGVSQVLFDRHIWTVQRGSEGWRTFSDRGSATANHEDHVHVSVYGSSGG